MKNTLPDVLDKIFNKFSSNQIITIIALMISGGALYVMFQMVADRV